MDNDNPWLEPRFAQDSYVLEMDRQAVERHNRLVGNSETRFVTDSLPEPFIGNPDSATVVLLGKNPGHSLSDKDSHNDPDFRHAIFLNLQHRLTEYPFYPLNPAFQWTGAGQWWHKRTRELREAGLDASTIAKKLMVIEWIPYHSRRFAKPGCELMSQKYSFWLAREMLKTKLIVRMRARAEWAVVGREFVEMPSLKNPQCGHISRGNTHGDLFDQIVSALQE